MMPYRQWQKERDQDWKTAPIDPECNCLRPMRGDQNTPDFCGKPTVAAYPSMGGGWASLCEEHAGRIKYCWDVYELILNGEKFLGVP